jgi:Phage integrase family
MEHGMNRPKDRSSAAGLLSRMEARPWKDGKTMSYRYHPVGGKPTPWCTDRAQALRIALDLSGIGDDVGTVGRLWQQYRDSAAWADLQPRTQADYMVYSRPLLHVFADMRAADITPPMVARYLRTERAAAPKRANREVSLLGTLIGLAIEIGEAETNPCRGRMVKRNPERPRSEAPDAGDMAALLSHAKTKGMQWRIITAAAEFAALVGARQAEFLRLTWPYWSENEVRLDRAKQRKGAQRVDRIESSAALLDLRRRLQELAHEPVLGIVFANRHGNAYTASGFACMWGKLMREAVAAGVVQRRFTFHDLRAHYTTQHKVQMGALPDMHASPTTTARVYERSRVGRRKAL